jgi:hypothetical protein
MQVEGQAHPSWIQAAPPSFATSPYYQEPLKSEITSTYQEFQVDVLEASQEVVEKKAFQKAKIKVASFLLASFLILIFNIIILCIFPKGSDIFTPVVILRSNCAETRRLGFWIHLLINALATLLILGSNVGMQTAELFRRRSEFTCFTTRRSLKPKPLSHFTLQLLGRNSSRLDPRHRLQALGIHTQTHIFCLHTKT